MWLSAQSQQHVYIIDFVFTTQQLWYAPSKGRASIKLSMACWKFCRSENGCCGHMAAATRGHNSITLSNVLMNSSNDSEFASDNRIAYSQHKTQQPENKGIASNSCNPSKDRVQWIGKRKLASYQKVKLISNHHSAIYKVCKIFQFSVRSIRMVHSMVGIASNTNSNSITNPGNFLLQLNFIF